MDDNNISETEKLAKTVNGIHTMVGAAIWWLLSLVFGLPFLILFFEAETFSAKFAPALVIGGAVIINPAFIKFSVAEAIRNGQQVPNLKFVFLGGIALILIGIFLFGAST